MHFQDNTRPDIQHENDFVTLSQCAGVEINPRVLRILVQLLELNVHPSVLHQVLQKICANHPPSRRIKGSSSNRSRSSTTSHSSAKSSDKTLQ